jgi:hypothetical protein
VSKASDLGASATSAWPAALYVRWALLAERGTEQGRPLWGPAIRMIIDVIHDTRQNNQHGRAGLAVKRRPQLQ